PALSVPAIGFPLLRVPKVHAQTPLAPLPHRVAAAAKPAARPVPIRKVVRHRVPVVSDAHAQAPQAPTTQSGTPKDPFAAAPVVEDTVGTPMTLAATPAQAPPAVPATPADTPATAAATVTAPAEEPQPQTDGAAQ